jgi:selenocysteine-specific elongation factor
MRRAIVGTAGHVDHGKTRLVLALTGIDCDRWAEEKARGITLDLGFAHLTEGDVQLGFIDVPGHEKFLHNALAGLGGVRVLLLVVAADEGVKPQTLEHLEIASLLRIPAAVVALTKVDLATPDLVGLATLEIEELLAATPFAGAPILPVSALTGQGIGELESALLDLGRRHAAPPDPRPARLPVDRAFHLKGLGVVVTGTLAAGSLRLGETLEILPRGAAASQRVRVRSLQVHGEPRGETLAGERTSVQVSGAELKDFRRGVELAAPGAYGESRSLLARYTLLPDAPGGALSGWAPLRLHLFAAEAMGRVRPLSPSPLPPGESGLVEIRLAVPVAAARGDRFIARRPSPAATLGGGEILDPLWRRHRGTQLPRALAAIAAGPAEALAFWAEEAGERGLDAAAAARRLGIPPATAAAALQEITAAGNLVPVATGGGASKSFLAPRVLKRIEERARKVVAEHFQKDRLATGMPKAEAARRILRGRGVELAPFYFDWLASRKALSLDGDQVQLPGRSAELAPEDSKLAQGILAHFEPAGLAAPSLHGVCMELKAKPQIFEGMVRHLVARGKLARLSSGLILAASALDELERQVLAADWTSFSVPEFKDRFELSRKWAIPLLEHLDSRGVTRRQGDERIVVRPKG